jgi:cytochrome c oxidase subunit 2
MRTMKRGPILVAVTSVAAFGLLIAGAAGQGTPTPAASPGAGTAVAQEASPAASPGATPLVGDVDLAAAERGRNAAAVCLACHSVDGSTMVGPTWLGLYGSEEELEDGTTVIVDDAYIHESIVDPLAKLTKGFPPSMPPFGETLTEEQIADITEYIKSLK